MYVVVFAPPLNTQLIRLLGPLRMIVGIALLHIYEASLVGWLCYHVGESSK